MTEIERLTEEIDLISELAEQNGSLRAEFERMKMPVKKTELVKYPAAFSNYPMSSSAKMERRSL